jgi:hypothetical protein
MLLFVYFFGVVRSDVCIFEFWLVRKKLFVWSVPNSKINIFWAPSRFIFSKLAQKYFVSWLLLVSFVATQVAMLVNSTHFALHPSITDNLLSNGRTCSTAAEYVQHVDSKVSANPTTPC